MKQESVSNAEPPAFARPLIDKIEEEECDVFAQHPIIIVDQNETTKTNNDCAVVEASEDTEGPPEHVIARRKWILYRLGKLLS